MSQCFIGELDFPGQKLHINKILVSSVVNKPDDTCSSYTEVFLGKMDSKLAYIHIFFSLSFKRFLIFYVYVYMCVVCVCVCVCVSGKHELTATQRGIGSLGAGISGGCKSPEMSPEIGTLVL